MKSKEKVIKEIRARKDVIMFLSAYIAVIGGAGILFASGSMAIIGSFDNDEYLTDSNIPYSQMDNATYTYTKEDLSKLSDGLTELFYFAGIITVVGASCFMVIAVSHNKRELHILKCSVPAKGVKFCPECGLEIKRSKKK